MTVSEQATRVLSCTPARSATAVTSTDRQLCPPENGQLFAVTAVLPSSSPTSGTPLDIQQMAGFWTLAFTMVVGLYVVSAHVGAVLGFIRRG